MTPEEKIQICITALVDAERLLVKGDVDDARMVVGQALCDTSEPTTYWRPMETAPKDETKIFVKIEAGGWAIVYFDAKFQYWQSENQSRGFECEDMDFQSKELVGWMPIPEN